MTSPHFHLIGVTIWDSFTLLSRLSRYQRIKQVRKYLGNHPIHIAPSISFAVIDMNIGILFIIDAFPKGERPCESIMSTGPPIVSTKTF